MQSLIIIITHNTLVSLNCEFLCCIFLYRHPSIEQCWCYWFNCFGILLKTLGSSNLCGLLAIPCPVHWISRSRSWIFFPRFEFFPDIFCSRPRTKKSLHIFEHLDYRNIWTQKQNQYHQHCSIDGQFNFTFLTSSSARGRSAAILMTLEIQPCYSRNFDLIAQEKSNVIVGVERIL